MKPVQREAWGNHAFGVAILLPSHVCRLIKQDLDSRPSEASGDDLCF